MTTLADFEPAAKRARANTWVSLRDMPLGELVVADRGKNKHGGHILALNNPQLTLGEEWMTVTYGFDLASVYLDKNLAILGGPGSEAAESLPLRLEANAELAAKIAEAEETIKAQIPGKFVWSSILKEHERTGTTTVGVKVVLKAGGRSECTQFKLCRGEEILTGAGMDFLRPFLDQYNGLRGCRVKGGFTAKVWTAGGRAGISLEANQLGMKLPEREPEVTWLFSDAELLVD